MNAIMGIHIATRGRADSRSARLSVLLLRELALFAVMVFWLLRFSRRGMRLSVNPVPVEK
jgi:hypothetical protein